MNGQTEITDGRMDKTSEQMDGWTDERTKECKWKADGFRRISEDGRDEISEGSLHSW